MFTRKGSATIDGLRDFGYVFSYCLTSDTVMLMNSEFDYYLLTLDDGSGENCRMDKGRLPEKTGNSNSIPPYTLWMDYLDNGRLLYTSYSAHAIKVVALSTSELVDQFPLPEELHLSSSTFDGHFARYHAASQRIVAVYSTADEFVICAARSPEKALRVLGSLPIEGRAGGFAVENWDDLYLFNRQDDIDSQEFTVCFVLGDSYGRVRLPLPSGAIVTKYLMLNGNDLLILFNAESNTFGALLAHIDPDQWMGGGNILLKKGSDHLREVSLLSGAPQTGTLTSEAFFDPAQKDLWLLEFGAIRKCKLKRDEGHIKFEACGYMELREDFDSSREVVSTVALRGRALLRLVLNYATNSVEATVFVSPCRRTQYFWLLTQLAGHNELLPPDMVEVIDLLL
jgi:hypothetical protein